MSVADTLFSPNDLLEMPDGSRYELVDGKLLEKAMGAESSWIASRICNRLSAHVDPSGLAWAMTEASYCCFPDDPGKVRRPDVSLIFRRRLPGGRLPQGHITIAPDLGVEVVSPNDLFAEIEARVEDLLAAGTALVWVVNPQTRTVHVYRAGQPDALRLRETDEIDSGDVLPDFRMPVADMFPAATSA